MAAEKFGDEKRYLDDAESEANGWPVGPSHLDPENFPGIPVYNPTLGIPRPE
jgi:hypothetical protein